MVTFLCAEEGAVSLAAHVHGLSELTIAMEGEKLEIQFTSPKMNLVGFEHKASSPKDLSELENAASMLRQHEALFLFSGSHCDHVKTSIDLSDLIEKDDHERAHQESSAEYKYDDGHTEHHEEHGQESNHTDVIAHYTYLCENIAQLSAIATDLFDIFPGIHKINTVWVKLMRQGAAKLTVNRRIVDFR